MDLSKKGFTGQAASNYFSNIAETVFNAQQIICAPGEVPLFEFPTKSAINSFDQGDSEQNYIQRYNQMVDDLAIAYSPDAICMDDERYEYVSYLNNKYDDEMDNKINYMIDEMKALCENHFQIPSATPKVEATLDKIRDSLPQSSDLAKKTVQEISSFRQNMEDIDQ